MCPRGARERIPANRTWDVHAVAHRRRDPARRARWTDPAWEAPSRSPSSTRPRPTKGCPSASAPKSACSTMPHALHRHPLPRQPPDGVKALSLFRDEQQRRRPDSRRGRRLPRPPQLRSSSSPTRTATWSIQPADRRDDGHAQPGLGHGLGRERHADDQRLGGGAGHPVQVAPVQGAAGRGSRSSSASASSATCRGPTKRRRGPSSATTRRWYRPAELGHLRGLDGIDAAAEPRPPALRRSAGLAERAVDPGLPACARPAST